MGSREGEPEEEDRSDELARHCDEVVADPVGDLVEEGEAEVLVAELDIGLVGFCPGDCEAAALERGLETG